MSSTSPRAPAQVDVAALYLRHRGVMRATAQVELGARRAHLVDDVISEVVQELVRAHRAGTLTDAQNWQAYLVTAVRRGARRVGRQAADRHDHEVHSTEAEDESQTVPDEQAQDRIEGLPDLQVLHAALDKLPERQRLIVEHVFWLGATLTQLSAQLGVTRQALGQQQAQALATLRKEWADDDRPA